MGAKVSSRVGNTDTLRQPTVPEEVCEKVVDCSNREFEINRIRARRAEDNSPCFICRGRGCKSCSQTGKIAYTKQTFAYPTTLTDEVATGDMEPCRICYVNKPMFGVSLACKHKFCATCIAGHLRSIQNSGNFPGYCPICEQEAGDKKKKKNLEPIPAAVLTFLQRHKVMTKEEQFRWMSHQERKFKEFFPCPTNCGECLKAKNPKKLKSCKCGATICGGCKRPVAAKDWAAHRKHCTAFISTSKKMKKENIAKNVEAIKQIGVKCPRCKINIQRSSGCDIMMCGTSAHGDLHKAIQSGGCGTLFNYKYGKILTDAYFYDQGTRMTGDPHKICKKKIAAYKKEYRRSKNKNKKRRFFRS